MNIDFMKVVKSYTKILFFYFCIRFFAFCIKNKKNDFIFYTIKATKEKIKMREEND